MKILATQLAVVGSVALALSACKKNVDTTYPNIYISFETDCAYIQDAAISGYSYAEQDVVSGTMDAPDGYYRSPIILANPCRYNDYGVSLCWYLNRYRKKV